MRRFVFYLIPIVTLAIFFAIMNGGLILKNSIGEPDHHFIKYYNDIKAYINDEQWEQAIAHSQKLEDAWRKKIPWIQFSVERDQINGIDVALARLTGYLEARDKAGALAELYEAKRHWDDLGR
ncbi:MAG: DUF4363 family protein [Thermoanaerobacteraceae bacterium]|nr:DUF4363 family protein [Thermoanaerobacteraceae bacterium]